MFQSRHVWFFAKQKWGGTPRDRHYDRSGSHFWLSADATSLSHSPSSSIAEWSKVMLVDLLVVSGQWSVADN